MEVLRDIGNSIGEFVKFVEQTRLQRYTTFARICVYMDLSKDLPEAINMNWDDEEWIQQIDYEQLPFQCRIYHEYGHFERNCPRGGQEKAAPVPEEVPGSEGFTQVKNRRRGRSNGGKKQCKDGPGKMEEVSNPF